MKKEEGQKKKIKKKKVGSLFRSVVAAPVFSFHGTRSKSENLRPGHGVQNRGLELNIFDA